jgi:farnesyl-diphosphate farnesyltransferase
MSMLKALLQSLSHPKEISAMFKLKFGSSLPKVSHRSLSDETLTPWEFCYAALNKVSRSFAIVIQQLPDEIKDAVRVVFA